MCSTSSSPLAIMCLKADGLCAVLLAKIAETLFFMLQIVLMLSLKHSSHRYLLIASELLGSILCLSSFFWRLLHIEPPINGICSHFKIHAGGWSVSKTLTHLCYLAEPWACGGLGGSLPLGSLPSGKIQGWVRSLRSLPWPLLVLTCGRPFPSPSHTLV